MASSKTDRQPCPTIETKGKPAQSEEVSRQAHRAESDTLRDPSGPAAKRAKPAKFAEGQSIVVADMANGPGRGFDTTVSDSVASDNTIDQPPGAVQGGAAASNSAPAPAFGTSVEAYKVGNAVADDLPYDQQRVRKASIVRSFIESRRWETHMKETICGGFLKQVAEHWKQAGIPVIQPMWNDMLAHAALRPSTVAHALTFLVQRQVQPLTLALESIFPPLLMVHGCGVAGCYKRLPLGFEERAIYYCHAQSLCFWGAGGQWHFGRVPLIAQPVVKVRSSTLPMSLGPISCQTFDGAAWCERTLFIQSAALGWEPHDVIGVANEIAGLGGVRSELIGALPKHLVDTFGGRSGHFQGSPRGRGGHFRGDRGGHFRGVELDTLTGMKGVQVDTFGGPRWTFSGPKVSTSAPPKVSTSASEGVHLDPLKVSTSIP
jgi:hypothetical protein